MERTIFLTQFLVLQGKQFEIASKKNEDYASPEDAFVNMRDMGELGILTRMQDKMARIKNLLQKENQVRDESIEDTLGDLANYANILILYLRDTKGGE
jgi:hypothetical protein